MAVIPCITIWQPWASLIVALAKPYEFRGWAVHRSLHGQRIGIHAGARKVKREEVQDLLLRLRSADAWTTCLKPEIAIPLLEHALTSPGSLPLSHVVGTAVLGTPVRSHAIVGEFGGIINDSDRHKHSNFAWPMREVEAFMPPIPAKGAQGFWKLTLPGDAA